MMDHCALGRRRCALSEHRFEHPANPVFFEALAQTLDRAKYRSKKASAAAIPRLRGVTRFHDPDRPMARQIGSSAVNTKPSATQKGDAQLSVESHLLFVGFDDAEAARLIALYAAPNVQLTFVKGAIGDISTFQHAPFDAVAIQIERCVLFAPLILEILRSNNTIASGADVIAVADQIIPNLADHLLGAGFASILLPKGDLGKIFPTRTMSSGNRPPFSG